MLRNTAFSARVSILCYWKQEAIWDKKKEMKILWQQYFSHKVLTCCRRDRAKERLSPGYCPAWCYDRGSGLSAAPLLASAGSVTFEEAASQRVAGMLQGHTGAFSFSSIFATILLMWGLYKLWTLSSYFVTCQAAGSVTWHPCLPTLPWLLDPQHGYTLGTCVQTQSQGLKYYRQICYYMQQTD